MAASLSSIVHVPTKLCLRFNSCSLQRCKLTQPLVLVRYCSYQPENPFPNTNGTVATVGGKNIDPKSLLTHIFNFIRHELGEDYSPRFTSEMVTSRKAIQHWKTTLTLKWPKKLIFEGTASSKKEGEKKTAALAWKKFKELGVLTKDNEPVLHLKQKSEILPQITTTTTTTTPSFNFLPEVLVDLGLTIKKWQEFHASANLFNEVEDPISSEESTQNVMDIITGRIYDQPSPEEIIRRSNQMKRKYLFIQNSAVSEDIQNRRQRLPIWDQREALISAIENNQVVVLSGETGCGKSTQVPQFILEKFIKEGKGAECNMVITQPRRISAISLAEYVASESFQGLRDTIGYQVKLDACRPRQRGGILFCTTGILLRHLQSNPSLIGVSHVIVDEAHERDTFIDILLVLLKNAVLNNPDLRVLIMSASINAQLFSNYFDNCPMFHVPGFMHTVQQHFLPEVLQFIGQSGKLGSWSEEKAAVDHIFITSLIQKIDQFKPEGGILCFLPGWQDIRAVERLLLNTLNYNNKYLILPVHSSLPHETQKKIFERAPPKVRKIVLATNIAETSITIDDIVYVIDSGIAKDNTFNAEKGISCIGPEWISKANVRQRKGRAGRVQPGECFHLFTKEKYMDMPDFPIPEMKRVALERVILDTKAVISNMKSEEFLSTTIEPPDKETILRALKELQDIGAVDLEENLTKLGQYIVNLPCDPRLAKTLIYSVLFSCAQPLISIAAVLSHYRDIFSNTLEEKAAIREAKCDFSEASFSDHIALANICDRWAEHLNLGENDVSEFCNTHQLNFLSMYFISGLKRQLAKDLRLCGFLDPTQPENAHLNKNSLDYELVKAILCAGLTNNIAKVQEGQSKRNRLNNKASLSLVFQKNVPLMVRGDSILKNVKEFPSPWLIFFNKMMSLESKMVILKDVSVISPLAILLFAGKELITKQPNSRQMQTISDDENFPVVITVDNIASMQFICTSRVAYLITGFRQVLSEFISTCLKSPEHLRDETSQINSLKEMIVNTLSKLLNSCRSDNLLKSEKSSSHNELRSRSSTLLSTDYDEY